MSKTRRIKRNGKQPASGEPIALHKRKVIKAHQNKGGYYEGMPGVTVDSSGNRKVIDFIINDEGQSNAYIYAHPAIVSGCLEEVMKRRELRNFIMNAVVRHSFRNRFNPLYIIVRVAFRFKKWTTSRKVMRLQKNNEHGKQL